jgi:hypothetical protein
MSSSGGASLVAPKRKTTGREQQRSTPVAKARTPNLSHFYRYKQPSVTPGDFQFMLDVLRPKQPPLPIDRMVDTLTWTDQQSTMVGSLTAYRPESQDPRTLPISRGQLVRCRVKWEEGTYQLWTMRSTAPQVELETGQVTLTLQDDMALLDSGSRDWWFRKTKHRPYGYTCNEVAAIVGRTLGIKIRLAAKGTTRFELKLKGVTGLAVLKHAYQKEKAKSGRAFIIRMRNGELEIVPLARNPMIYLIGPQIQTAALAQKTGQKVPTTVLTGHGRLGHGHGTRGISYTDYDRSVVKLLGYVHDTHNFGRVSSHAELRGLVQRELAKRLRLNDTISITHQGIPFILRGDGIELELPAEGYKGSDSFVFCTRAVHTVQAGVYQTQWDFTATDPYIGAGLKSFSSSRNPKTRARKAAAKRRAKRVTRPRPKLKGRSHP